MFYLGTLLRTTGASLVAQRVKNPPAMQETQVQSLGQEDSLVKSLGCLSGVDLLPEGFHLDFKGPLD